MFESTMIVPGSYLEQAAQLTLNSVESYIKLQNMPNPTSPEEALYMKENAKKPFYGKIIPAAPILMQYILEADKTEDQKAVALDFAYAKHVLDPEFIEMLMQYLAGPEQTASSRAVVGAYLTLVLNDLLEKKEKKIVKIQAPGKVKEGEEPKYIEKETFEYVTRPEDVKHISEAISTLLGATANWIQSEYPTLNDREALGVAAAVCMANNYSIKALIDTNLAVTAKLFDMLDNNGQNKIIVSALNIKKDEFQKLTGNQQAFVDSLKRWIYGKLNSLTTTTCYQFLVGVYGTIKPTDLSTRLIYIKDCGTSYVNLLQVAKQLEA